MLINRKFVCNPAQPTWTWPSGDFQGSKSLNVRMLVSWSYRKTLLNGMERRKSRQWLSCQSDKIEKSNRKTLTNIFFSKWSWCSCKRFLPDQYNTDFLQGLLSIKISYLSNLCALNLKNNDEAFIFWESKLSSPKSPWTLQICSRAEIETESEVNSRIKLWFFLGSAPSLLYE